MGFTPVNQKPEGKENGDLRRSYNHFRQTRTIFYNVLTGVETCVSTYGSETKN